MPTDSELMEAALELRNHAWLDRKPLREHRRGRGDADNRLATVLRLQRGYRAVHRPGLLLRLWNNRHGGNGTRPGIHRLRVEP